MITLGGPGVINKKRIICKKIIYFYMKKKSLIPQTIERNLSYLKKMVEKI